MSSALVNSIFSQLSCLLADSNSPGSGEFLNERLRTKALHLAQQLTTALQKPADAALELGLLVRYLPGYHMVIILTVHYSPLYPYVSESGFSWVFSQSWPRATRPRRLSSFLTKPRLKSYS